MLIYQNHTDYVVDVCFMISVRVVLCRRIG